MSKMYIAIIDDFPDYMAPTLVAHSVLAAHLKFEDNQEYKKWLMYDFRKVVLRVNKKEFDKISNLPNVHLGHEKHTNSGMPSCAVVCPFDDNSTIPNVLKFAKLWSPTKT